jgi:hypothetical protein
MEATTSSTEISSAGFVSTRSTIVIPRLSNLSDHFHSTFPPFFTGYLPILNIVITTPLLNYNSGNPMRSLRSATTSPGLHFPIRSTVAHILASISLIPVNGYHCLQPSVV